MAVFTIGNAWAQVSPNAPVLISLDGEAVPSASWERVHDVSGLPLDSEGWTDLLALYQHPDLYNDTRIVYVSTATGSDASGQYYQPSDPEIGVDPFNPVGRVNAFASLSAAYDATRDGQADMLLLRRGDTWTEDWPGWNRSGASEIEPFIVATYDVGGRAKTGEFLSRNASSSSFVFENLIFAGIEPTGISVTSPFNRWLVEDVSIGNSAGTGLSVLNGQGGTQANLIIRRSVFYNNYPSGSAHVQGIYVRNTSNLLIEENVLDHNGWREGGDESDRTIYNHNIYLAEEGARLGDIIVRRNISARASSHGVHQRPGGLQENNLFLRNPIVQMGYGSNGPFVAISRYNVTLDSDNIGISERGQGLSFQDITNAEIYQNIVAHNRHGGRAFGIMLEDGYNDVLIRDNIVYDWSGVSSQSTALSIRSLGTGYFRVHGNDFQQVSGDWVVHYFSDPVQLDIVDYANNRYYSSKAADEWFYQNGGPTMSFSGWVTLIGEQGASNERSQYPDANRNIFTYMQYLFDNGIVSAAPRNEDDALESFLQYARQLSPDQINREYFTADAVNDYIREGFGLSISN